MYETMLKTFQPESTLLSPKDSPNKRKSSQNNSPLKTQIQTLREAKSSLEAQLENQKQKNQNLLLEMETLKNESKFSLQQEELQRKELELQLKSVQQRNMQNQEISQRKFDDLHYKAQQEQDELKLKQEEDLEKLNESFLDKMKDLRAQHSQEIQNLEIKLSDLRSKNKSQTIELLEYKDRLDSANDQTSSNFETFHIKYLEEIRSINSNMSEYRIEKQQEIKSLRESNKTLKEKNDQQRTEIVHLKDIFQKEKEQHEKNLKQSRKKLDECFKCLAEHEKCQITIMAQQKRINEFKKQLRDHELNQRWTSNQKRLASQIRAKNAEKQRGASPIASFLSSNEHANNSIFSQSHPKVRKQEKSVEKLKKLDQTNQDDSEEIVNRKPARSQYSPRGALMNGESYLSTDLSMLQGQAAKKLKNKEEEQKSFYQKKRESDADSTLSAFLMSSPKNLLSQLQLKNKSKVSDSSTNFDGHSEIQASNLFKEKKTKKAIESQSKKKTRNDIKRAHSPPSQLQNKPKACFSTLKKKGTNQTSLKKKPKEVQQAANLTMTPNRVVNLKSSMLTGAAVELSQPMILELQEDPNALVQAYQSSRTGYSTSLQMINTSTENPYSNHQYSTAQDQPQNQDLMTEIRETKQNLAVLQEEKSTQELELKKEILKLRLELEGMKNQERGSLAPQSEFEFRFDELQSVEEGSIHKVSKVNESAVQSTCFNLGCSEGSLRRKREKGCTNIFTEDADLDKDVGLYQSVEKQPVRANKEPTLIPSSSKK